GQSAPRFVRLAARGPDEFEERDERLRLAQQRFRLARRQFRSRKRRRVRRYYGHRRRGWRGSEDRLLATDSRGPYDRTCGMRHAVRVGPARRDELGRRPRFRRLLVEPRFVLGWRALQ